jgi:TolB-like protein
VAVSDEPAIPAEAVRAELERVLASKGFQNAGRLSRLLRHITEKTLAGDADQLKEYAVGVEVFDRDASYDPRLDSIVRVEAGRLRSRLDEYYANGSAAGGIRITLPRGGYVAQFIRIEPPDPQGPAYTPRPQGPADTPGPLGPTDRSASGVDAPVTHAETPVSRRTRRSLLILAAGSGVIVGALLLWLWLAGGKSRPAGPAVAVLSFAEYSSDPELRRLAARVTDDVTSELARLQQVEVVSHTSAMQFAGTRKPLKEIAATLKANFIVEGSLDTEPGGVKVVLRLVNAATDRKAWVQDYHVHPEALHDLSRVIARDIATAVLKVHSGR